MKLGYLGIDQYGNRYKIDKHPRKELLEKHYLTGKVSKMYRDGENGDVNHVGYIIGNLWVDIYEVHDWKGNN
jgi:hypothetical protein